jgi:MraZ protein
MSLFLSTFENKIDKKGRVSVPASFRTVLKGGNFKGFVAFRSLSHPCVEGFSMERMTAFSKEMDSFQLFAQDQADVTASVFADAEPLAFDAEGRVMLSPAMLEHAGFEERVCFVGRGATFQLWNPESFQTYQHEARERLKSRQPQLSLRERALAIAQQQRDAHKESAS